jgi:hypothetical protein
MKSQAERLGRRSKASGRRLGGFIALGAMIIGAVVFGFILPGTNQVSRRSTFTPGPSPTYTLTPTALNATALPVVVGTSAPLSELLDIPYTPPPLYVEAKRSPITSVTTFNSSPHQAGKWDEAIPPTEIFKA